MQTRTQEKNRVQQVLEDSNIKLASVVSDVFGKRGRQMLRALLEGERAARMLATMALGRLQHKLPELEVALTG